MVHPIIKASPFSTRNVPKRYVGIKKSVARELPHYFFRQFFEAEFENLWKLTKTWGFIGACGLPINHMRWVWMRWVLTSTMTYVQLRRVHYSLQLRTRQWLQYSKKLSGQYYGGGKFCKADDVLVKLARWYCWWESFDCVEWIWMMCDDDRRCTQQEVGYHCLVGNYTTIGESLIGYERKVRVCIVHMILFLF